MRVGGKKKHSVVLLKRSIEIRFEINPGFKIKQKNEMFEAVET